MRGSIVYATDQGLGIQAKSFFDHGLIDEVLIWHHSTYENHYDWYPNRCGSVDELLGKIDTLVLFETPFDWKIVAEAKNRGIRVVMIAMYECTKYPFPHNPDVIIGGSAIEVETYKNLGCNIPCFHINAPVEAVWKKRSKALTFVHNAGHGGLGGRNGTKELLEAMKYVKSPIKLIVRHQVGGLKSDDPRVEIVNGSIPYEDLWKDGDVFIIPEKFGGSFLPMQEAFASGMAVMASNRFPTNAWLPTELLIPVSGYRRERIGIEFECAIIDPKDIAVRIDRWFDKDISKFSEMGKEWAKQNSWKVLKPKYERIFTGETI